MMRQDEQTVLNESEKYILHLISCSLNGGIPREKPEVCNWSEIVELLEHNSVLNAVSPAVKRYPYEITPEIRKKIETALQKTVYRLLHFQVEREAVFSAIRYLVCDGCAIMIFCMGTWRTVKRQTKRRRLLKI